MSEQSEPVPAPVEPKAWWQSRAIIGSLVTVLAALAPAFGLQVDQAGVTETLVALSALIGGALSIWGRVAADRPISLRKPPPAP